MGLKRLSNRGRDVFFRRPWPGSGQFRPVLAWRSQVLDMSGSKKAGLSSIWVAGGGRSVYRVFELLESDPLGVFEKLTFFGRKN